VTSCLSDPDSSHDDRHHSVLATLSDRPSDASLAVRTLNLITVRHHVERAPRDARRPGSSVETKRNKRSWELRWEAL
jgi:hypothetical protein